MHKHFPRVLVLLFTLCCTISGQQSNDKEPAKIEAGIHFTSFTTGPRDPQIFNPEDHARSEAGAGARFGYNLTRYLALEAEVNFFPNENQATFVSGGNLLQGQFGAKVGKRWNKVGLFAKGRPGFLNFSQVITQTGTQSFTSGGQTLTFPIFGIERRNFFSLDVGGVLEFYPSRRILVRFDAGDTIVRQGDNPLAPFGLNTQQSRYAHKFQFSSGIAFRFLNPESPDDVDTSSQSSGERKFEVGAQFSSLGIREFEYSLNPANPNATVFLGTNNQQGLGGRFTYHFVPSFAAEVQADFYPGHIGSYAGGTAGGEIWQVQAGAKVGKRFRKWGLFGKARPGIVSFSDTFLSANPQSFDLFPVGRTTYFSLDIGGVLEFYPSPRIVARFDGGDTMIRYGGGELGRFFNPPVPSPPAPYEFRHNFQFSAGVGFRF